MSVLSMPALLRRTSLIRIHKCTTLIHILNVKKEIALITKLREDNIWTRGPWTDLFYKVQKSFDIQATLMHFCYLNFHQSILDRPMERHWKEHSINGK